MSRSPASPPALQLIDGKLGQAADGASFPILNPATGLEIGRAPDGTEEDAAAAIAAARRAFDETNWASDVALRIRVLRQFQRALADNAEPLRALTVAEAGAPVSLTTGPHFDAPVEALKWMIDLAESYEWETDLGVATMMGIRSGRTVRREAAGVVSAITPWNFPNQINLAKIGPALAAGNTVVLKPAPDTPWLAAELGRLAAECTDMPPGVFNVVTSRSTAAAALLTTDPRVDLVSFTGSSATGRAVASAAAPTLKRLFLELGGKSAAIVLDDADLPAAVGTAAFSVSVHAGQGCALTTRLLVPRAQFDDAVEIAAATMAALRPTDPADPRAICGPVISAAQRDRIKSYLDLAAADGATFATGGGIAEQAGELAGGYWIEPTVIAGLDNSHRVASEEIFGPVLTVIPHDGDDDAVRLANDSPYGLSGSVDSADLERAMAVAKRIRTGTVGVNGGLWFGADAPFGGYKQSGFGREMGLPGFEEYLQIKTIAEPAG